MPLGEKSEPQENINVKLVDDRLLVVSNYFVMSNTMLKRTVVTSRPKNKPLLVYDGDCGFCSRWADRLLYKSHGKLECAPFQKVATRYPEVRLSSFQRAVQFIDLKGEVSEGAEATFRALSLTTYTGFPLWCYSYLPGFKRISEKAYQIIARNRSRLSVMTAIW